MLRSEGERGKEVLRNFLAEMDADNDPNLFKHDEVR